MVLHSILFYFILKFIKNLQYFTLIYLLQRKSQ